MRNKYVKWGTLLLAAFVGIVAGLKHFGWLFYEVVDDPQHKMFTESFAYKCYGFYNLFHLYSYHGLKLLAASLPMLPVYDLLLYGALFIAFVNLNIIFYQTNKQNYNVLIPVVLFLLLFECIAYINSTRISLLLAFSGVIILCKLVAAQKHKISHLIYLFFCLLIAADFRLEAAMVGATVGLFFFIISYWQNIKVFVKNSLPLAGVLATSFILCIGYVVHRDSNTAFKAYSEVEPAITNCIDRNYFTLNSLPDTGRLGAYKTAATGFFVADKQVFNKVGISKITSVTNITPAYHFNSFILWKKISLYILSYGWLLSLVLFSCTGVIVWVYGLRSKEFKAIIAFFALILLLSLAILWYLKMERRLMIPFVYTIVLYCMYTLYKTHILSKRRVIAMLFPIVLFWVADIKNVRNNCQQYRISSELNKGIYNKLAAEHSNEAVAIDYIHSDLVMPEPFDIIGQAPFKVITFDSPYVIPGTQLNCEDEYITMPYISFFNELVASKVVFVMDDNKAKALTEYFSVFYGINYRFQPVSKLKFTNASGQSKQVVLWMAQIEN